MPAKHIQQTWPRLHQSNRQPKGGADDGRAPSVLFTGPAPAMNGRQGFGPPSATHSLNGSYQPIRNEQWADMNNGPTEVP